jgi:hypothetical protein
MNLWSRANRRPPSRENVLPEQDSRCFRTSERVDLQRDRIRTRPGSDPIQGDAELSSPGGMARSRGSLVRAQPIWTSSGFRALFVLSRVARAARCYQLTTSLGRRAPEWRRLSLWLLCAQLECRYFDSRLLDVGFVTVPLVPVRLALPYGVTDSDGKVRSRVGLGCAMPMIDVGIDPHNLARSARKDLAQR